MIDIKNLSFRYMVSEPLFADLDFSLNPGSICGLLGKNGAGKTTLLRIICGLLFPQGGNCEILGYTPKDRLPKFLKKIYFIPEEFYVPSMTANQYEKLYSPFYAKFDSDSFHNYLKEFDLPENKKLPEMSYGQKKKFLISFGIATNCNLLLLDEPTNGLDIPSKSQLRKLLAKAISDEKTFIISTHQVRDIENLIDPIIILDNGEIVFNHPIDSITKHLSFDVKTEREHLADAFYHEKTLNGYRSVTTNHEGFESKIDLEMLFNAVILNKNRISKLFEEEGLHE